jgi:hypothetical protein
VLLDALHSCHHHNHPNNLEISTRA